METFMLTPWERQNLCDCLRSYERIERNKSGTAEQAEKYVHDIHAHICRDLLQVFQPKTTINNRED